MSNLDVSNDIDIKTNNQGTVSLFLGFLSIVTSFAAVGFILGIIGLIYGFIGLRQINRYKQNGKRKTVTGIICCLFGIFLTISFSITTGVLLFN